MEKCETLTVPEAAKALGIGRSTAFLAVKRGEIPHLKIGKRIVIPVAALQRMLENASQPGQNSAQ